MAMLTNQLAEFLKVLPLVSASWSESAPATTRGGTGRGVGKVVRK